MREKGLSEVSGVKGQVLGESLPRGRRGGQACSSQPQDGQLGPQTDS